MNFFGYFWFLFAISAPLQAQEIEPDAWRTHEVSVNELENWPRYGAGETAIVNKQLVVGETAGSKGFMLVSPQSYGPSVILRYDLMILESASVIVNNLSATGAHGEVLEFPEEYDANIKYLFENFSMYMIALNNAAHNMSGPFIRKFPIPGRQPLTIADKQATQTGIVHAIEVGKVGQRLWLKVDGQTIVETQDSDALGIGHLMLRIRGTGFRPAAAIFKNLRILTPADNN